MWFMMELMGIHINIGRQDILLRAQHSRSTIPWFRFMADYTRFVAKHSMSIYVTFEYLYS